MVNNEAQGVAPNSDFEFQNGHVCPLCSSTQGFVLSKLPIEAVWEALARVHHAEFSDVIIARHSPSKVVALYECELCGMQYFYPTVAGDSEFYRELTTSSHAYYVQEKWEFQKSAEMIMPNQTVLDIGCGAGRFLEIIRNKGGKPTGIDTNPAGIKAAQSRGLDAHCVSLDEFAEKNYERFDAVCAFQVLEHLPAIEPFVRLALSCLKPGGKLILSVPNRERRFQDAFEPLDCPPHHLTHWSGEQFKLLARNIGCRVASIQYQLADVHDCRALLRRCISNRHPETWWARAVARIVVSTTLYRQYARFGLLTRWKCWRMSLIGILEKPLQ